MTDIPQRPPDSDAFDEPDEQEDFCALTGFEQPFELGRLVTAPPAWALDRPDIAEKLRRPGRPALTGGIASGKSTVAGIFERLGAAHIDFDILARRAVAPGTPGLAAARELLGPEVIRPDGALDRPRVAALIFSNPELKAGLENIIHPRTWELMAGELDALADRPVVVISVPLLFEAGLESFFDPIVLVFAGCETRIGRLLARQSGLDRAGAERLIAGQWPDPPKVMGATWIINNGGGLAETTRQTEAVWERISRT